MRFLLRQQVMCDTNAAGVLVTSSDGHAYIIIDEILLSSKFTLTCSKFTVM